MTRAASKHPHLGDADSSLGEDRQIRRIPRIRTDAEAYRCACSLEDMILAMSSADEPILLARALVHYLRRRLVHQLRDARRVGGPPAPSARRAPRRK